MAASIVAGRMTADEFLELDRIADPDIHRELINGEVREYPNMTHRNARHAEAISRISHELLKWLDADSARIGTVASGEARCRLVAEFETLVGLDVAYFEGKQFVDRPANVSYFDGPPVVAVEVLSASDTHEDVSTKIEAYLTAGVKQVWIVDPRYRTVTVFRSDRSPALFAEDQEFRGEPKLPGFQPMVRSFFGSR